MNGPRNPQLTAAIRQIWLRAYKAVEQQVGVLEVAAAALERATLDEDTRAAAEAAAHNLAGSAGTFGFAEASALARNAEQLLEAPTPADAPRLREVVDSLAALLRTAGEEGGLHEQD